MANNLLDPKMYEHVSSDDKQTVLRHKQGHVVTIAHSVLSAKMRKQLEALANNAKDNSKDPYGKVTVKEDKEQPVGKVQMMASGGDVEDQYLPKSGSAQEDVVANAMRPDYTPPEIISPSPEVAATLPEVTDVTTEQPPQMVPSTAETLQAPAPNPVIPQEESLASSVMTPQAPASDTAAGPMSGYGKAIRLGMQGLEKQAQAQSDLGQARAKLLDEQNTKFQQAQDLHQKSLAAVSSENDSLVKSIKEGKISPDQYWTGDKNGNGSHSKLLSAIGIILAGFNPTTQPNMAAKVLENQIERNLQAQKENLGAKKTLLEANLRKYGVINDALAATRLNLQTIALNELEAAGAKAMGPQAQAAKDIAKASLIKDMIPLQIQMSTINMINKMDQSNDPNVQDAGMNYLRQFAPEKAKEREGRIVPGVGTAKVPVPDGVRQEIVSHQKLQDAAKETLEYSQKHTNLVPGTPAYNTGVQKAAILQQMVREGLLGTVFRDSEKPLLQQFVDTNPAGALKFFSTQPKLKTLIQSNEQQLNALKKTYGLPETHGQGNTVKVQSPDGTIGNIPASNLGKALQRGYKQVK